MSSEEMRSFCESIKPYQIAVQVKLKEEQKVLTGHIGAIDGDKFELLNGQGEARSLRYTWVSGIKHGLAIGNN